MINPFDSHGGLLRAFGVTKSSESTSLVAPCGQTESMFSRVSQASATHNPWMCGVPPPSISSTKALVSVATPPTPIAAIDIITDAPDTLTSSPPSSYEVSASKSTSAAPTTHSGGFLSKLYRVNLPQPHHTAKAHPDGAVPAASLARSRHFAPFPPKPRCP